MAPDRKHSATVTETARLDTFVRIMSETSLGYAAKDMLQVRSSVYTVNTGKNRS